LKGDESKSIGTLTSDLTGQHSIDRDTTYYPFDTPFPAEQPMDYEQMRCNYTGKSIYIYRI